MVDRAWQEGMREVLDEVYRDRETAAVRDVYSSASRHLRLSADMLAHLNELPEGAYTRQEMAEAINEVVRGRGEQEEFGLLDRPSPIEAVEESAEAERAVRDEAPLEALNPAQGGTEEEPATEFREPGTPPDRGEG